MTLAQEPAPQCGAVEKTICAMCRDATRSGPLARVQPRYEFRIMLSSFILLNIYRASIAIALGIIRARSDP